MLCGSRNWYEPAKEMPMRRGLPAASLVTSLWPYWEKGMSLARAIQYTSACCAACTADMYVGATTISSKRDGGSIRRML